ncbi:MAG: hypothetical protein U0521_01440 [Anaerolineae bacterium]
MKFPLICALIALMMTACAAPLASFADLWRASSRRARRGAFSTKARTARQPARPVTRSTARCWSDQALLQNFPTIAPVADAGAPSLAEYAFNSITQPGTFVVSGFGNTMYAQYARQLVAADR